jgi:hypothetical protein
LVGLIHKIDLLFLNLMKITYSTVIRKQFKMNQTTSTSTFNVEAQSALYAQRRNDFGEDPPLNFDIEYKVMDEINLLTTPYKQVKTTGFIPPEIAEFGEAWARFQAIESEAKPFPPNSNTAGVGAFGGIVDYTRRRALSHNSATACQLQRQTCRNVGFEDDEPGFLDEFPPLVRQTHINPIYYDPPERSVKTGWPGELVFGASSFSV